MNEVNELKERFLWKLTTIFVFIGIVVQGIYEARTSGILDGGPQQMEFIVGTLFCVFSLIGIWVPIIRFGTAIVWFLLWLSALNLLFGPWYDLNMFALPADKDMLTVTVRISSLILLLMLWPEIDNVLVSRLVSKLKTQ